MIKPEEIDIKVFECIRDIQKISEALSCRVCSVVVPNLINKC